MRLCIVGGALQGTEAAYLAGRAGYSTVVIERRPEAPALSICDRPVVIDPLVDPEGARDVMLSCDAVLPACEERPLLGALPGLIGDDVPLLFDLDAYDVTSSKGESNRLMASVGIPLPEPWPDCGYPAVVKPSSMSGSVGVTVAHCLEEVEAGIERVRALGDEPVVQGFVHGRSVSMEVIGDGGSYRGYVTTEVVLDRGYDCKEVRCHPGILGPEDDASFRACSERAAAALGLDGLMDMEAILTPRGLRYLEMDARIPSQTPAAILTATGLNLLERLVSAKTGGSDGPGPEDGCGIYFHVLMRDGTLSTTGEKEFSRVSSPRVAPGLFGSDDSITDYRPGADEWHGTFMVSGRTPVEAEARRLGVIRAIMEGCGAERFVDASPEEVRT